MGLFSHKIRRSDLPNLIVLLISTGLGIAGLAGAFPNAWQISGADALVLIVLGLLATSFFFDRVERAAFERSVAARSASHGGHDCLTELGDLPRLDEWQGRMDELWVSGVTLMGFLELFTSTLEALLADGARVRLLLVPPQGELASRDVAFFSEDDDALERHANQVRLSLIRIRALQKRYDRLQARFLSVLPAHNLTIINPEGGGEVRVHFHIYHLESDAAPVLRISWYEEQDKFGLFVNEFQELWSSGTDINSPKAAR